MSKRAIYRILAAVHGDYRGRAGDAIGFELEAGDHTPDDPVLAELLEHLVSIGLAELVAPTKSNRAKGD